MNLYRLLSARAAENRPVRVGLIGAGTFGTMFLAQAQWTPGLQVVAVADLSIARARAALRRAGWPDERGAATSFERALATGATHLTAEAEALIAAPAIEVVVE